MIPEQSNPHAKRRRPIIKTALIAIGVAGGIAGAMHERQTIESAYAKDQARLDTLMRWSESARASAAADDDATATTALRRALRDAEQGQRRWNDVTIELASATHELRYAEAQRSDTIDATTVEAEDIARIEAALTALADAGARSYRRKYSVGETLEATARMAFVGVCAAYFAVAVAMIFWGLALVLAWLGLDAIDWARRARNAGEDA